MLSGMGKSYERYIGFSLQQVKFHELDRGRLNSLMENVHCQGCNKSEFQFQRINNSKTKAKRTDFKSMLYLFIFINVVIKLHKMKQSILKL
jgi:hypothetical protein